MSTLGTQQQTTVSFKVYNFKDYDEIYMRYFLKPGALVFVDWGWNNTMPEASDSDGNLIPPELYTPHELLGGSEGSYNDADPGVFLHGKPDPDNIGSWLPGWLDYQKGNVKTVYGYVTNYDSK